MLAHTTSYTVHYYETDKMGVVHHSNYIRYFETARDDMMNTLGIPYALTEEKGIMMPVRNVSCEYLAPAHYGETLSIVTQVQEMPRSRMTFHTSIYNAEGVLLVKGCVVLAFLNTNTGRPTRAPQFLTDVLEKLLNL